jgi:hypothetical protein
MGKLRHRSTSQKSPPSTFDRPAPNVSGSAACDREPPKGDFFQKAEKVSPEETGHETIQ